MAVKKPFLDIEDRQREYDKISEKLHMLNEAFQMIPSDYSHHIEVILFKPLTSELLSIKEDVDFRIFSSRFHLELLFKQHFIIENELFHLYRQKPHSIFQEVYPSHPLFDKYEREITSIVDSIVFHLASIFDYLSSLINFICNKKDRSITKWTQLARSCRDSKNHYFAKGIGLIIQQQDQNFVQKLYTYRSRLIHEKSSISSINLAVSLKSGKVDVKFLVTDMLCKMFPDLKAKSEDFRITAAYAANFLINNTISSIAILIYGLKAEMESCSTYPNHIAGHEIIMLYRDPVSGVGYPASKEVWERFSNFFSLTTNPK